MRKDENGGYEYASAEQVEQVRAAFPAYYRNLRPQAEQEITELENTGVRFFTAHGWPDVNSREGKLAQTLRQGVEWKNTPMKPGDEIFEQAFEPIFLEEYSKQYITPAYLGQAIGKRAKLGLAEPGSPFMYCADCYEGVYKRIGKLLAVGNGRMERLENGVQQGSVTPQEYERQKKTLWIMHAISEALSEAADRYQYITARGYLMDDQKAKLIEATSKGTFDRAFRRCQGENQILNFQLVALGETMGRLANTLEPGFDTTQAGLGFDYFHGHIRDRFAHQYDMMRLNERTELPVQAKAAAETLTSPDMVQALADAADGLAATHRVIGHSDSAEMSALKNSLNALREALPDSTQKILDTRGAYGQEMQQKLNAALESAENYLAAKDSEGKSIESRSQMGQKRYRAAQALAQSLRTARNTIDWQMTKEQLNARMESAPDADYKALQKAQMEAKERLFTLANKPEWTASDRSAVNAEIAALVARQKLEVEYLQTRNTDGPMWQYQKAHGDFVEKIARAIRDDAIIRNATDGMDQEKLMQFLNRNGERQLNLQHAKELVVQRTAAAQDTSVQTEQHRENEVRQMQKEPPVRH